MDVDLSPILASWRFLLAAIRTTLALSAVSIALGFLVGAAVGVARGYGGRGADIVLGFYVDTARAIPVLVILVWIFFAAPVVLGAPLSPFLAAVLGLSLHIGAYFAETIRGGLLSIRRGQVRAAQAIGMTFPQILRTVLLPQALIRMLPALGSLATVAVKDTAVASVIAVPELMRQSQILAGQTFRPFEIYTAAMLVYCLICLPLARASDRVYARLAHKGAS